MSSLSELMAAGSDILQNPYLMERVLRQAAAGVVVCDCDQRLLLVNAAARRLARRNPEGAGLDSAPDAWGQAYAAGRPLPLEAWPLARALRGETVVDHEVRMVRSDGVVYDLRISSAPIRDHDGRIMAAVATFSDISQQKACAAERPCSEAHLQTLMDVAPIGMFVCDADGRCTYNNPKWLEISGRNAADNLAFGWAEAIDPADRPDVLQSWQAAALAGVPWCHEHRVRRADGTCVWVRAMTRPLRTPDNRITGFVGTVEDITQHKQGELALRESAALFEGASKALSGGVYEWDLHTDIIRHHHGLVDLVGIEPPAGELTGAWWIGRVHPEDRDGSLDALTRSFDGVDRQYVLEYRIRHADGRWIWVSDRALILRDTTGRPVRVIGGTVDITAHKMTVAALQAAKAVAERATREKSHILAAASHDLRQPLQTIVLLLHSLRRHVSGARGHAFLAQIEASLARMIDLFNTLLDLSRLEAGAVQASRGPVAIADLFALLATDYQAAAAAKGLGLRFVASTAVLWTDATLLERMLRNLVSNAVRYTETGHVLVGCRRRPGMVRIDVIDTGPGIPPEHRARIFDAFYRGDTPAGPRQDGHGLGLAIVRRAADVLDCKLDVASTPGRGTRVSIGVSSVSAAAAAPQHTLSVDRQDQSTPANG